jgi:hypothetical protein
MALKDTLFTAVNTIMTALEDVPMMISYYSVSPTGSYNVATDSLSKTETLISCQAVKYKSKVETQDWKKTELDETKILIAGSVFVDAAVTPKEDDYMIVEGVRYEIKNIRPAPTNALYVFVVRAV